MVGHALFVLSGLMNDFVCDLVDRCIHVFGSTFGPRFKVAGNHMKLRNVVDLLHLKHKVAVGDSVKML